MELGMLACLQLCCRAGSPDLISSQSLNVPICEMSGTRPHAYTGGGGTTSGTHKLGINPRPAFISDGLLKSCLHL